MEQTANIVSFPGLGWEFEIDRVAFHIGSLPVYWYGILIALGFILAILYVTKRAKEFGVDPDRMLDVVLGRSHRRHRRRKSLFCAAALGLLRTELRPDF